jgi:O-antigen/teichoic acid export membrane protein
VTDSTTMSVGGAPVGGPFGEPPRPGELGRHAARGGMVVMISVAASKLINLIISAVLARLLTPYEFGLIGMIFTLTGLLQVFGDLGMPTATVQKVNLESHEASTSFWLTVVAGLGLWFVTIAAAPAVAWFYNEPSLVRLTIMCGLIFPVEALGYQHTAILMRRFQFARIAVCEIVSGVAGGIIGIVMAAWGFRASALVAQYVLGAATLTLLAWVFCRWLPSRPSRTRSVLQMLRFGGYLTAYRFVNYFSRNLDNVLVGHVCGTASLGLYARAYALMTYPIALVSGPLSRVALPALSQLQGDAARMREAYMRILRVIAFITFPLMTLLFVTADDLIAIMYGKGWAAAVPIFRILCIAGIYQGVYSAAGQVFTASGRTDRMLWSGIVYAMILSISFFIGVRWQSTGVAWAFVVVSTALLLPYLKYTYATVDQRLGPVLMALWPMLAASILMGVGCAIVVGTVARDWPAIPRFGIAAATSAIIYLGVLFVFWRGHLRDLVWGTIGRLLPAKPAQTPQNAGE